MGQYKVQLKPRDERCRAIALRSEEAIKAGHVRQEYKFRSGKAFLALITISHEYLLYRLENYRTSDQQLSLIAAEKVEPDFFSPNRREDPSVQQAQHGLLLDLARTGSGQSIKPIYDELERVQEQTDPLIITHDGVVVNGNRRLAAMRDLLTDPEDQSFSSFAHVNCLVLPESADPREILQLEIGLQMQPDTKLPYAWTAIGRAARDLRKANVEDDDIAALMNRDVKDVRRFASMIDAADQYLVEWLGKPNAYMELDKTEQAFEQIVSRNFRDDEPQLREITRQFDFFLVEQRDHLPERAYGLINKIEENPRAFLEQMAVELDIQVPKLTFAGDDKLEISFDESNSEEFDYSVLVEPLKAARVDKEHAALTVKAVAEACAIVASENKDKGRAPLNFARQAYKAAEAIELRRADPETFSDIYSLMIACKQTCERLIEQIETQKGR